MFKAICRITEQFSGALSFLTRHWSSLKLTAVGWYLVTTASSIQAQKHISLAVGYSYDEAYPSAIPSFLIIKNEGIAEITGISLVVRSP